MHTPRLVSVRCRVAIGCHPCSAGAAFPDLPAPAAHVPAAEDEADSAAVKRKRSAEEEEAARQLKGISSESKKRLLEVAALPLAGTPLEVGWAGSAGVWTVRAARCWHCWSSCGCADEAWLQSLDARYLCEGPPERQMWLAACRPPCLVHAAQGEVSPPAAVRAVDLAQRVWPEGAPSRPAAGVALVMSPEGAYSDFHLAAGGASGETRLRVPLTRACLGGVRVGLVIAGAAGLPRPACMLAVARPPPGAQPCLAPRLVPPPQSGCTACRGGAAWRWCLPRPATWPRTLPGPRRRATPASSCLHTARG